jgi:hypothetical protein
MGINRRQVLRGAGAALLLPLPFSRAGFAEPAERFYSGAKTERGFEAVFFNIEGQILKRHAVRSRPHGGAVKADKTALTVFSRRPGDAAYVFAAPSFELVAEFKCPADRRFNGHGCYSPDGQFLFTAENDFENECGVIGINDAQNSYSRVGEFDSFGVGPHEIIMMSDGVRLAIANGGIATHPDFPRQKLNIPDMKSNITYLDWRTGALLEQTALSDRHQKLSLRHICEGPQGSLWIGGQYEGQGVFRDLVGWHVPKKPIAFVELSEDHVADLKNYVGSVAISADQKLLVATCPRGNQVLGIKTQNATLAFQKSLKDCSGAARTADGVIFSSGAGELHDLAGPITRKPALKWDNHLSSL